MRDTIVGVVRLQQHYQLTTSIHVSNWQLLGQHTLRKISNPAEPVTVRILLVMFYSACPFETPLEWWQDKTDRRACTHVRDVQPVLSSTGCNLERSKTFLLTLSKHAAGYCLLCLHKRDCHVPSQTRLACAFTNCICWLLQWRCMLRLLFTSISFDTDHVGARHPMSALQVYMQCQNAADQQSTKWPSKPVCAKSLEETAQSEHPQA